MLENESRLIEEQRFIISRAFCTGGSIMAPTGMLEDEHWYNDDDHDFVMIGSLDATDFIPSGARFTRSLTKTRKEFIHRDRL